MIETIGLLAAVISFTIFLPQALRTWRVRRDPIALAGISTGTQWLILSNAVLWGAYAVLTQAFWVGAPGLLNGPLAIATIFLVHRATRGISVLGMDGCRLCIDDVEHQIFITAPPGWGSIMPCSATSRSHGLIVLDRLEIQKLRAQL